MRPVIVWRSVLLDTNHRQNILPLFCTKRIALARQDLEVPQPSDIPRFYENPSRSFIYSDENPSRPFIYSDELRNHVLAVPQPFTVSVRWPAIQFYPGYATCSFPRQIRNFFALFSVEEYRTVAICYLQTPDRWDSESHPYYSEPAPVEGLKVYVATDYHLQTPVITSRNKFMLDDVTLYALKPFYLAGEGRALCAVCLCRVQKNSDITVRPSSAGPSSSTTKGKNTGIIGLPVVFMCLLSSIAGSTRPTSSTLSA
jgi:hypothetical protein